MKDFVAVCPNKSVLRASFALSLELKNLGQGINIIKEELTSRLQFKICIHILNIFTSTHCSFPIPQFLKTNLTFVCHEFMGNGLGGQANKKPYQLP